MGIKLKTIELAGARGSHVNEYLSQTATQMRKVAKEEKAKGGKKGKKGKAAEEEAPAEDKARFEFNRNDADGEHLRCTQQRCYLQANGWFENYGDQPG